METGNCWSEGGMFLAEHPNIWFNSALHLQTFSAQLVAWHLLEKEKRWKRTPWLCAHIEELFSFAILPDAASPTWEQLENAMVAVKTVVHGLVDFIQNYSRKGHEIPQVVITKQGNLWSMHQSYTSTSQWRELANARSLSVVGWWRSRAFGFVCMWRTITSSELRKDE